MFRISAKIIISVFTSSLLLYLFSPTWAVEQNVFDLSLEELGQIKVTAGSLISTERRFSPNSIIVITRDMIESSGARNMNELLSTFVPSFHYLRHPALPDRIGMRGIISDLNDKVLLLVNGKHMNSQPLLGIDSEIDLSMLGDIEKIEVVNGPGSATYGPGALNGIVSITTRNADNYEGMDISGRIGAIEEFYNAELQWGGRLNSGGKIYMYYGLDKYTGADKSDTPVYFGSTFKVKGSSITVNPDSAVDLPFVNDHAADRNLRHKAFVDYRKGDFNVWARYTEGGTSGLRSGRALLISSGLTPYPEDYRSTYGQFTAVMDYSFIPNMKWKVDTQLAFDHMNASWYLRTPSNYGSTENKYSGKVTVNWNPSENQSVAAGIEIMHGEYEGLYDPGTGVTNFNWNTNYYALLAENFWHFLPRWRSIVSVRADTRTDSDYVFSPRLALIYEPVPSSTLTISWSLSNRLGDEYYNQYYRKIGVINSPGTEKTDTAEVRYTQMLGNAWMMQMLIYNANQEIMAWDHVNKTEQMQGNVHYYGAEFLVNYRNDKSDIILSHAYNKMTSMSLNSSTIKTLLTSEPYGYGDDFHMTPSHITKFILSHKYNEFLTLSANLQRIWAYEGADDFARYNREVLKNAAYTITDTGRDVSFEGPTTLNVGAIYSFEKRLKINIYAHNVLGWFNEDFNGRRYYSSMDAYRIEAPGLSIGITRYF